MAGAVVRYYDKQGNQVALEGKDVPPLGVVELNAPPAGFVGSAVISPTSPIVVMASYEIDPQNKQPVNVGIPISTEAHTGESFILHSQENSRFSTGFAVQNVGNEQTTCNVTFRDPWGQQVGDVHPLMLPPMGNSVDFISNMTPPGTRDGFSGSATINCDQPVAFLGITQNKQDAFLTTEYASSPDGICY